MYDTAPARVVQPSIWPPSYWFVLPESFHPGEFLKDPRLSFSMDDARYFMNLILIKLARRQVDQKGVVRLAAAFLRKVMHPHKYNAVVNALLERGAVERLPYAPGECSFGYRPSERYIRDKHVRVPVTCPRLAERLRVFHEDNTAKRRARMKPVHHCLEKLQHRLEIDGVLARETLASMPAESNPFDTQGILVADIEHRNYRFNVGRYRRVSNNITSMKREVRTALRVGHEALSGVDIMCAQPGFLVSLIQEQEKSRDMAGRGQRREGQREGIYDSPVIPPIEGDFERYKELVEAGRLYEELGAELSRQGIKLTREAIKRKFLSDVIAKRKASLRGAEYPSDVERVFRDMFASVYLFIRWFNADGWEHANLIRELQRQESKFVIDTVAAALVKRFPNTFFITLHDSIYTTPGDMEKVRRAFEMEFDRMGFAMRLRAA